MKALALALLLGADGGTLVPGAVINIGPNRIRTYTFDDPMPTESCMCTANIGRRTCTCWSTELVSDADGGR